METESEKDAVVQDEEAMDEMAEVGLDEPEQQEPAGQVPDILTRRCSRPGKDDPDRLECSAMGVIADQEDIQAVIQELSIPSKASSMRSGAAWSGQR
jgi:hypothetical protein